jgi:hypothetical protein
MKSSFFSILALVAGIAPAYAITVTAPVNGAQLTSPFTVTASAQFCESEPTVSMGYSLDYGKTTIVPKSFSAAVVAGDGQHTLHVKCWGSHGAHADTSVDVTVGSSTTTPPSGITVVSDIQSLPDWAWDHDPATHGSASGYSDIAPAPSVSGNARQYSISFSDSGGEIFHKSFGKDTVSTHFIYDSYIWLENSSSIANIEMDLNQVIANGDTVIYGVQCDGYSGTWDYTLNIGSPDHPRDKWNHSNIPCPDPKTWEPHTWHHVQLSYSRDGETVTYESVVLDGEQSDFVGATGNSAFRLGWGATLLTNFQLDGHGSEGSATAYVDKFTISRW